MDLKKKYDRDSIEMGGAGKITPKDILGDRLNPEGNYNNERDIKWSKIIR